MPYRTFKVLRTFTQLAHVPLLIIDDFGLKPLRPPADNDLHELIAERYETASTIVTSNLDLTEWDQAFPAKLLGLKGSLNEYELDLLRQRSQEARYEKARRGELIVAAPVGYLKTGESFVEKDPDQRVQQAIALLFRKFVEIGSVRQTLLWFLEHGLQLPARTPQGETCWKRPSYGAC